MPMQLYVTQGPPLFVIGRMGDTEFKGEMERRALAGFGDISLTAVTAEASPANQAKAPGVSQITPGGVQITPGGVQIESGGVMIAPDETRTVRGKAKTGDSKAAQPEGKAARETPSARETSSVQAEAGAAPLQCKGRIDNPPTRQGRLHALLPCNDGRFMALSLRNIGPDQGFGLARIIGAEQVEQKKLPPSTPIMPLFYHSGEEEAKRRFVDVNRELLQIQKEVE